MQNYPTPPTSSLEFDYDEETDLWGAATEYNTIFVREYAGEYEVEVYSALDDSDPTVAEEPEAFFRIEIDANIPSESSKLRKLVHILEGVSPVYLMDTLLDNIDLVQVITPYI